MSKNKVLNQKQIQESKCKWRYSINQFSKMEQEIKLGKLDNKQKKSNAIKIKMINRLAQIDEEFIPMSKTQFKRQKDGNKLKQASTNIHTNIQSSEGLLTNLNKLQESVYINENPEDLDIFSSIKSGRKEYINAIRQQILQELTEYNPSRYVNDMKIQNSKYKIKSQSIYHFFVPQKPIYEFCYFCDEVISNSTALKNPHKCNKPLDSLNRVQQALLKIQKQVKHKNNKIFSLFLANTLSPKVQTQQLIDNVRVLKQAIEHQYQPQQAILRMRLMNLIGKKIGLLIQEEDLDKMLISLANSLKK